MPSVGGRLRGPGTPEPPWNPALTIAVGRFHRLAKLVVFFAVSSFRYLVARAVLVIHRELRRSSSSSSSASFSFVLSGGVTVRLTLAAFCNWPRFHLDPRSPQSINRKSHLTVKCKHRRKCSKSPSALRHSIWRPGDAAITRSQVLLLFMIPCTAQDSNGSCIVLENDQKN